MWATLKGLAQDGHLLGSLQRARFHDLKRRQAAARELGKIRISVGASVGLEGAGI